MSCSISLIVEVKRTKCGGWHMSPIYGLFSDLGDYVMYAYLAGVRGDADDDMLVPSRGIPEDISKSSEDYLLHPIINSEVGHDFEWFYDHPCRPVEKAVAEKWINEFGCRLYKRNDKRPEYCYELVSDPNYHSYNWCTTQELAKCIRKYKRRFGLTNQDWSILLSYMKACEKVGYEVRAIYWFEG